MGLKGLKRLGLVVALLIGSAALWGYLSLRALETRVLFTGPEWDIRVGRYLRDQRALSQNPWFRGGPARIPVPAEIKKAAEVLPEPLLTRFRNRDISAAVGKSKERLPPGLAWMSKLAGFDYWAAEGASPPWFLWSTVRRTEGERNGDVRTAYQEGRELARLAGTTHRWADAVDMMLVLHSERNEYDLALAEGRVPVGFAPFDRETLERGSRVIEVAGDFFDFRWQPATLAAVFGDPAHRVGLCAAIERGFDLQLRLRVFLEAGYPDRFRTLDQILAQSETTCRLGAQRRAWADRTTVPEAALRIERLVTRVGGKSPPVFPAETFARWKQYSRIPWLNRYLGLKLAEMSSPSPELLRQY